MLCLVGLPLFFMELSFGQFASLSPLSQSGKSAPHSKVRTKDYDHQRDYKKGLTLFILLFLFWGSLVTVCCAIKGLGSEWCSLTPILHSITLHFQVYGSAWHPLTSVLSGLGFCMVLYDLCVFRSGILHGTL